MKKKFIELNEVEKITLQEREKNGKTRAFRTRCHCLRLSAEGYRAKELASIFRVSEISVYTWFRRWEQGGIECLEKWIKEKSDKPRVIVLDNARIHRSKRMQEKLAEWDEKGFYIFNLPTYSPHLNIIEILW